MALLSVAPAREMCFALLAAIVLSSVAKKFDGVWSAFINQFIRDIRELFAKFHRGIATSLRPIITS